MQQMKLSSSVVAIALALMAGTSSAAIISVTVGGPGSATGGLLLNPSFEIGASGNQRWAGAAGLASGGTPNGNGPSVPIPNWTVSSGPGAYGWWGPLGFAGAPCSDGPDCLYFGNTFTTPSLAPTFHSDGTVTFAGSPTFTSSNPNNQTPVDLAQTVGLTVGNTYVLDFWVSGEANTSGFGNAGVFQLFIGGSNVFLTDPGTAANPGGITGAFARYTVTFTADNALEPITFRNYGHVCGSCTELVLDDLGLHAAVPEPGTLSLAALAALGMAGLRRRRR